jgi:HSP20 family protein
MTNALVERGQTSSLARTEERSSRLAPWSPFRDLFGFNFDPFANLRSLFNMDFDLMNVSRTDETYEVEVPVPGFKPDQIELTYKDGLVTVSGKNERRQFQQSFTVPDDIDPDKTDAKVEHGMLLLSFERRPEAQPKRIKVK